MSVLKETVQLWIHCEKVKWIEEMQRTKVLPPAILPWREERRQVIRENCRGTVVLVPPQLGMALGDEGKIFMVGKNDR